MSGIATAIVASAVVTGGAMYMSGKKSSKAASEAAAMQSGAQAHSTYLQLEYLRETRADIAKAVDDGLIDLQTGMNMAIEQFQPMTGLGEYNAARGLLQDPSAIMDRPATKFQYEQGIKAMQAAFSRTSGGGISGPGMKSAIEYGQNFASQALDAELNRLFPFMNAALEARTNIANLYQGKGIARANLRVGGATGTAGVTGAMMPSITQGIVNQGNIGASQAINQANIYGATMQGMAGIGSNLAMMYGMNPQLFSRTNPPTPMGSVAQPNASYFLQPNASYFPERHIAMGG